MTLAEERPATLPREGFVPVLETERLVLRAPHLHDAKAVTALANDIRIAQNTARIPHPYTLEHAEEFIAAVNRPGGELVFLITGSDGEILGACGVGPNAAGEQELGYWLGVRYWGQGLATEAVRAVLDYTFGECQYPAISAGARVTNPASRRVLEKCGFQWTGVKLQRIRAIASSAPIDRFKLDRSLWLSLKSWGLARRVA